MNKEYENLISKFYDLTTEEKKKEIFDEFLRINEIFDRVSRLEKEPISNRVLEYDQNNDDSEDENLTKIYNDMLVLEERLVYHFKNDGY